MRTLRVKKNDQRQKQIETTSIEAQLNSTAEKAAVLCAVEKEISKRLKTIKSDLASYGPGEIGPAKIMDTTTYSIQPSEILRLLKKKGQLNLIDSILTVKAGEVRKLFGDTTVENLASISKRSARVSITPNYNDIASNTIKYLLDSID